MRFLRSRLFSAALIGILGLARLASATTITAELTGMHLPNADTGNIYYNSDGGDAYVGAIGWDGSAYGNPSPFNGNFDTYCIDLTHDIYIGGTYQFTEDTSSTAVQTALMENAGDGSAAANEAAALITKLYETDYPGSTKSIPENSTDEAAFQLSIWNLIYNPSLTSIPSSGQVFTVAANFGDQNAITLANSWLKNLSSTPPVMDTLYALDTVGGSQGQVYLDATVALEAFEPPVVPMPMAVYEGIALMAALAATSIVRRRIATGL
jgi:hypothetical protein